jgi:hypothetical protein
VGALVLQINVDDLNPPREQAMDVVVALGRLDHTLLEEALPSSNCITLPSPSLGALG